MKLAILIFITFLSAACGNFFREKPSNTEDPSVIGNSSGTIAFSEVRDKVFIPNCVKCHSNYSDYRAVKKNIAGILNSVEQNRMPKNSNPLSEDLKSILRLWVAEGANENLGTDPGEELPIDDGLLKPTWDSLSLNIFGPKCLVCHNPNGQAPWVDLTNRASMAKTLIKHIDFKNIDESNLILRLRDTEEPMPPLPPLSTIPQLTEEEVLVVIEWVKAGLP